MRNAETATPSAREAFRAERIHLVPALQELRRILGRGAVEWRSDGAEVELSNGSRLLDFGSYGVTLLGHRPRAVVDAVLATLETMPTSTRLLTNPTTASLATRLAGAIDAPHLRRIVLGLNGSDVVEAALKLAVAATGRTSFLAVRGSFHGKSLGALSVTDDTDRRRPFTSLLAPVRFLDPEPGAVRAALTAEPAAALIFEPVQGEGGGMVIEPNVLRQWTEDARAEKTFIISDEIQVGLRRCGPLSIVVDHGIEVDAVLFGKTLGGGVMPLSALLASDELAAPLLEDPFLHTSTFGGHPLSCAAGIAAVELLVACERDTARVTSALSEVMAEVKGGAGEQTVRMESIGLFGVIECVSADSAHLLLMECARRGLLVAPCLSRPTVVRLLPPVTATGEQIERAGGILADALRSVEQRSDDA